MAITQIEIYVWIYQQVMHQILPPPHPPSKTLSPNHQSSFAHAPVWVQDAATAVALDWVILQGRGHRLDPLQGGVPEYVNGGGASVGDGALSTRVVASPPRHTTKQQEHHHHFHPHKKNPTHSAATGTTMRVTSMRLLGHTPHESRSPSVSSDASGLCGCSWW